jgi:hypothetical protein
MAPVKVVHETTILRIVTILRVARDAKNRKNGAYETDFYALIAQRNPVGSKIWAGSTFMR